MHAQTQQRVDQFLRPLQDRTAHVIGISGIEGYTMAHFLISQGHQDIVVHDYLEGDALGEAFINSQSYLDPETARETWETVNRWPIRWQLGEDYLHTIRDTDYILLSQNWFAYAQNKPLIPFFEANQERLISLLELTLAVFPGKTIGITGSNGKSTTVALTGSILQAAGKQVRYAGNDRSRPQVLLELDEVSPQDTLVMEISNRQLKFPLTMSPQIAVVTNVLPNHIVDHGSFEAYQQAKASIFGNQVAGDTLVLNGDDATTRNWQGNQDVETQFFSNERESDAFVRNGILVLKQGQHEKTVMKTADLPIVGKHFVHNAMAALLAANALGVNTQSMTEGIGNFRALTGRLELVMEHNGIRYYNDIKSTVPQATVAALDTLSSGFSQKKIILMCGGEHKQVAYDALAQAITNTVRELILLPGTASEAIRKSINDLPSTGSEAPMPNIHMAPDLSSACAIVREQQAYGDLVLISPAGAFFQRAHFLPQESVSMRINREFLNE